MKRPWQGAITRSCPDLRTSWLRQALPTIESGGGPAPGAGLSRANGRSRGSLGARRGPGGNGTILVASAALEQRARRRRPSVRRAAECGTATDPAAGAADGEARSAASQLEQRIGTLEQKPAPSLPDLGELRQRVAAASAGVSDLTSRLERLEKSAQSPTAGIAELKAGLEQLGREQQAQTASLAEMTSRLNRAEQTQQAQAITLSDLTGRLDRTQQAEQAQAADVSATLGPLQQDLLAQQSAVAELRSRLQALEKTAQSRAGDLTDMGLTLALLQIRNAAETGRPFPAEYDALSSLAKARPEIAAAAAPLAERRRPGSPTRVVLAQELREWRQGIDAAPETTNADGGWGGAALARLRGLVTIRRVDGPSRAGGRGGGHRRRAALGGGDLPRAVAAIEKLKAGAAAAAQWLRMARQRLAVDAALRRLEALLTARLGERPRHPARPADAHSAGAASAGRGGRRRRVFRRPSRPGRDRLAGLADRDLGRGAGRGLPLCWFSCRCWCSLVTGLRRAPAAPPLASGQAPAGRRGRVDPRPRRPGGGRCGRSPAPGRRARALLGGSPVALLLAAEAAAGRATPTRRDAPTARCSTGATPSFSGCAG